MENVSSLPIIKEKKSVKHFDAHCSIYRINRTYEHKNGNLKVQYVVFEIDYNGFFTYEFYEKIDGKGLLLIDEEDEDLRNSLWNTLLGHT